jgi:hypothetical protein
VNQQQLQEKGFFQSSFEISENEMNILSNAFFDSQSLIIQNEKRSSLISGNGFRNIIFQNIEKSEIPDKKFFISKKLIKGFLETILIIFNDWKEKVVLLIIKLVHVNLLTI